VLRIVANKLYFNGTNEHAYTEDQDPCVNEKCQGADRLEVEWLVAQASVDELGLQGEDDDPHDEQDGGEGHEVVPVGE